MLPFFLVRALNSNLCCDLCCVCDACQLGSSGLGVGGEREALLTIFQSPGCCQGTTLAPVTVSPTAGLLGLETLLIEDATSGLLRDERRDRSAERLKQTCRAEQPPLQSRKRTFVASDSGVASGRDPGCRPGAVTDVTQPAATLLGVPGRDRVRAAPP
jgi:hypothetical protein